MTHPTPADHAFAPAPDPVQLAWLDLNDRGNAERLIARAGGRLAFIPEQGWIAFNGRHWSAADGDRLAYELANAVGVGMFAEADALKAAADSWTGTAKEDAKPAAMRRVIALRVFALDSGNLAKVRACLGQAEMMLMAQADTFDADPLAWATPAGTLRVRVAQGDVLDVRTAPNAPSDRLTRQLAFAYDEDARAPLWDACIEEWLPQEDERRYVQAALGYALSGLTREQVMFIFQGRGGDGKSTLMNTVRHVMGGYAATADVKTFLEGAQRGGGDASPDLARLAGDVRLVSTAEPPRGARLNEALIKSMTGGAPILARRLQKDFFEYRPHFKLFMECNPRPVIRGDDDGIWRRIQLVMFRTQIPKDRIDRSLEDRLRLEGPGILNWLLEGLRIYLTEGLQPPAAVQDAIDDYRKGANPFGEWWSERVEVDTQHRCEASVLYVDYEQWCGRQGFEPMKQRAFGDALADRQVIRAGKDRKGKILRRGARLRDAEPSFAAVAADEF